MADNEAPDLKEALKQTEGKMPLELRAKKVLLPEDVPPPPGDWVSHPITRTILYLILAALIVFLAMKGPGWFEYIKGHPYGFSLVIVGIVAAIVILSYSYWRTRARGDRGDAFWHLEDIKKKE